MPRPLRVGDRVTATGTVVYAAQPETLVHVRFDSARANTPFGEMVIPALTLITPAEPPVGSVVVKDGAAYHRSSPGWHSHGIGLSGWRKWDDISDGDVIFTPGVSDA